MAEYEDRERFMPLNTTDIIRELSKEIKSDRKKEFEEFSLLVEDIIHHESQAVMEELENLYFPLDPDSDKISIKDLSESELKKIENQFYEKMSKLLDDANFDELSDDELEYALEEDSEIAVEVEVDLDDFDKLIIFKRGKTKKKEKVPKYFSILKKFFKKEIELDIYNRIIMIIKFDKSYDPKDTTLKKDIRTDKVHLKSFKNVPEQDIEMILPNPKVKMGLIDKLKIVIPMLIGIGAGTSKFLNLITGETSTIVTISVIAALVGYMIKSYVSYKNTILDYITNLTSGLYFRNLGNNESVMHYLGNEAEEEETKETILGYYFISKNEGITTKELDNKVEKWFEDKGIYIDLEVNDAIRKLKKLNLIKEKSDGGWKAVDLEEALTRLDKIWDNYYSYNS